MEGIVFSGWHTLRGRGKKRRGMLELSEAPQACKEIEAELDLIDSVVKLQPPGC